MNDIEIAELKKQFKKNDVVCEKVINTFSLISNKTRFRALCLLSRGDYCVSEIVDIIQYGSFSNISQQLKLLTLNGILTKQRKKKQVFYHLADEKVRELIRIVEFIYLAAECEV